MELEDKKAVVSICISITGVIIGILTIYWLYCVYSISFEIQRIYLAQEYCGSDAMEKETLRYNLKDTSSINSILSNFQKTVTALSIIGFVVIFTGLGFQVSQNIPETNFNVYFQILMFIIIISVILTVTFSYSSIVNSSSKYTEKWNKIESDLDKILNQYYTTGSDGSIKHYFMENGLSTFPKEFVTSLVDRWRSEKYTLAGQQPTDEIIYTNTGLINELETYIFTKKDGKVVGVNTAKFLELLRPENNINPPSSIRKRDLEYINSTYHDWACINIDVGSSSLECKDTYITYLPELSFLNQYDSIIKDVDMLKTIGWVLLTIMLYSFYHQYYIQETFVRNAILITVIILFVIMMYYMIAVRNNL